MASWDDEPLPDECAEAKDREPLHGQVALLTKMVREMDGELSKMRQEFSTFMRRASRELDI